MGCHQMTGEGVNRDGELSANHFSIDYRFVEQKSFGVGMCLLWLGVAIFVDGFCEFC